MATSPEEKPPTYSEATASGAQPPPPAAYGTAPPGGYPPSGPYAPQGYPQGYQQQYQYPKDQQPAPYSGYPGGGAGYQAGAQPGVYPPGPPGYQAAPGQAPTYTQTTIAIQPQQPVVIVGGCPACRIGVLEDDFTCLGVCCAIFFFPIGLLCCLAMRQRRCPNCGAVFG